MHHRSLAYMIPKRQLSNNTGPEKNSTWQRLGAWFSDRYRLRYKNAVAAIWTVSIAGYAPSPVKDGQSTADPLPPCPPSPRQPPGRSTPNDEKLVVLSYNGFSCRALRAAVVKPRSGESCVTRKREGGFRTRVSFKGPGYLTPPGVFGWTLSVQRDVT